MHESHLTPSHNHSPLHPLQVPEIGIKHHKERSEDLDLCSRCRNHHQQGQGNHRLLFGFGSTAEMSGGLNWGLYSRYACQ